MGPILVSWKEKFATDLRVENQHVVRVFRFSLGSLSLLIVSMSPVLYIIPFFNKLSPFKKEKKPIHGYFLAIFLLDFPLKCRIENF